MKTAAPIEIVSLKDIAAHDAALVGGKAANLARLLQMAEKAKAIVPSGFALTRHVQSRVLGSVKNEIGDIEGADSDYETLSRAYKRLCHRLKASAFPDDLMKDISTQLEAMGPVAVRSSATCEDGSDAAFAGQHDTLLNVVGPSAVTEAIQQCFASFYSPQAVLYRRQAGLEGADARMAVVVQDMVACDRAGVAFALNPISGALQETVINANFGLGESVVSGEVDVDQIIYNRVSNKITETHVGEKRSWVPSSGDVHIARNRSDDLCLSNQNIKAISDLTAMISDAMGYPQDIEWGIKGDELYLLQSRPITRLPEKLTRDESAERFPNAVTPMTWGLVEEGFHRSLNHSFALMDLPPYDGKWFQTRGHYVYGNQTVVELYHKLAASKALQFDLSPEGLLAMTDKFSKIRKFVSSWHVNQERFIKDMAILGKKDPGDLTLAEKWEHVEAVNEACARFFEPNIAISLYHTGLSKALETVAELLVGEEGARLVADLRQGLETRTSHVNRAMLGLVELAMGSPALMEQLSNLERTDQSAEDLLASGVFEHAQKFETKFAEFIADHGHREVDFDPYHAPWGDAPHVVCAQIVAMAGGLKQTSHKDGRQCAFAAKSRLLEAAPQEARFVLSELIDLVLLFEELDDLEHYSTSRVTRPIRKALLSVGEDLKMWGVIADPRMFG